MLFSSAYKYWVPDVPVENLVRAVNGLASIEPFKLCYGLLWQINYQEILIVKLCEYKIYFISKNKIQAPDLGGAMSF